jgi:ABC-type multidrug transport system permease subunit
MDCEIITFEVERKVLFLCARQGQQGLNAFGETFLNYANLMLFTISMHIILGTCVPNFRCRG